MEESGWKDGQVLDVTNNRGVMCYDYANGPHNLLFVLLLAMVARFQALYFFYDLIN